MVFMVALGIISLVYLIAKKRKYLLMTNNKRKDKNLKKSSEHDFWKEFKINSKNRNKRGEQYILIGRGWENIKQELDFL
jgi:hypothetical protein